MIVTLKFIIFRTTNFNISNKLQKGKKQMISILGLILSLILIMYLAYKGYSTIITAPIISILTLIITTGVESHLMANYTEVYMSGFSQ